jgi:prepilin-type N-terminal cleavage/methylation domain-containing protein
MGSSSSSCCFRRLNRACRGMTLVEVMLATLVLALLAIGGGAFLQHGTGQVMTQQSERVAAELANGRLDELRASGYASFKPTVSNYTIWYLQKLSNSWARTSTDPSETVTVGGKVYPMRTTVQYQDVDGGAASYDYVQLTVAIRFRAGSTEEVVLTTLCGP